MKAKKITFIIMFIFACYIGINSIVEACVGRTLNIGYKDYTEQHILAQVLGILIEERTGTKVVLKEFDDTMETHKAMVSNEVQMYVEYTGVGLTEILGMAPIKDPKKVFNTVKKAYDKNFDFVWLKTFGFSSESEENESVIEQGVPCEAAPVVRKDVLKKYPALARLINKLNNKVNTEIIAGMVAQVDAGKTVRDVAGQFLAKVGISFNFTPAAG